MLYGNKFQVYVGPSGLSSFFALPRPYGLGYEILAFQAIAKMAFDGKASCDFTISALFSSSVFIHLLNLTFHFLCTTLILETALEDDEMMLDLESEGKTEPDHII